MEKKSKDGTVTITAEEAREAKRAMRELRAWRMAGRGLCELVRGVALAFALDELKHDGNGDY